MSETQRHILYVEDQTQMRALMSLMLRQSGFEVSVGENKADALELLKEQAFDLVLLDYLLPDGNGAEICSAIRELNKDVTVLIFSATASAAHREASRQAGCTEFISKSIDIPTVLQVVKRYLLDQAR